ncbi:MAG: Bifunctional polymyxin resistance protein ArnA [Chromatiales bacterium USCg_Taylor]|nr:MAG: Bifunctional polymyxin resistance protein ArnA [Chromatiales bacterium USCg_Taylor]
MKILILTQEENLYLPNSFAQVCRAYPADIACIVAAPAMSTHGGPIKGFFRHLRLFGFKGTAIMACRVVRAKWLNLNHKTAEHGPFHSIAAVARTFGIPYHAIGSVNTDLAPILDKFVPELLISISCPQIIGKAIRQRLPRGCINVHGAPLPRYRGLMPAFWALKYNEAVTAVTVHDLSDKLDNGSILAQREVAISPGDTWDSLVRKTKAAGAELLVEVIRQIQDGREQRRPNLDEQATYFSFPTAADRRAFVKSGRCFF